MYFCFSNLKGTINPKYCYSVMKKITFAFLIAFILLSTEGYSQLAQDGSYLWNSTSVTYSVNAKTDLVFGNKDQFSNQIDRLEYYHLELIGYRKLTTDFSIGLGLRQTENYKSAQWNPGQTILLYGVCFFNPGSVKIKFANRITSKFSKTSTTQLGLDNITNVDFFTHSTNKLPRPYLMDELFSSLSAGKIQTIRIYAGFRLFKTRHFGLDLYYCYWKNRSTANWKDYNVAGINTKFWI